MTSSAKPVCLIGGDGFIGRALRRLYASSQRPVTVVGRTAVADMGPNESFLFSNELGEQTRASAELSGGVVIDLAYPTMPSAIATNPDVAEEMARRHYRFATQIGAERYLYLSSGGCVYGRYPVAVTEQSETRPCSTYGVAKLAAEQTLLANRMIGTDVVIARPGNVYGIEQIPFRGQGLVATAFGAAIERRPLTIFGDGSQVRDYLFADDCAAGIDALMERGDAGEVYNLGTGEGTSVSQLLARIATIVQEDSYRQTVVWANARSVDVESNILDSGKAKASCGWQPRTSLDDGLRATWDWLKRR